MELSRPHLIIFADAPGALASLFGISMLERLLRTIQRLGFHEATILYNSNEIPDHLAVPSWARSRVALTLSPKNSGTICVSDIPADLDPILIISAGFYY